ncbi:PepSY-associated TM helix domain-containing protein [Sphingomonas sp. C3-2]|uniref:PepSY-associated TM helix domain-containing protein n=1 Tax=Sphingomonas sp. C3-2 TaxID=3062169 RepID=UPI00294AA8CE|nr:PepSY-associated TM helix domain-containing protein [Sphingomonas sp. C3-2]WOK36809.1 PepSY-associated TM helix domain-containing protein [Sphingomonas sp. C3-2]
MKLPTDLVKMYKEIHGWVGIISGLALFIAFYAGAITMFETPLQRWASPPSRLAPAPSLERTPELVAKVLAAHPEAAKGYELHLQTDSANPARMSWTVRGEGGDHDAGTTHYAALTPDGGLQVESRGPSEVAELIDVLHQQVGLPFAHEVSMPIMGAIALLYMVAIVSGLIVLLPSLVSDLFALRLGRNVKRMWLDMHNVVGLFSLPFHIIMALTAIVFAFHDQFYDAQDAAFGRGERPAVTQSIPVTASPLPPAQIVARLRQQAPGFTPLRLDYHQDPGEPATLRVEGHDARYGHRAPTYGIAGVDPYDGTIIGTDYMPGHQDGWSATVTSFFALHFGNFGGNPIRWSYFLLGIAGAFLFYTGNLLWVESRRKRERKAGAVVQSRSTRILGALTVGVPIGCIAGISVTLAAAKLLGEAARYDAHSAIYYVVFVLAVAWALLRGAARAGIELPLLAAATMLTIPAASLIAGAGWYDGPALLVVDIIAIVAAGALVVMARAARNRAKDGPRDSIWAGKSDAGLAEATSNPC